MMKAVMYHYVHSFNKELPLLKNLNITDFRKQLDYFEKEYGFISKEDFLNCLKTGEVSKGVVLTFDDALKCHYTDVYKELKKRNLWGIFYIPTSPYTTNKLLDVHRIHLLLGIHSGKVVYKQLIELIKEDMLTDKFTMNFKELTYKFQKNDDATQLVKRILNYYISYDCRENVIDQLIHCLVPEHYNDVRNFYLNSEEIVEMSNNEMIIGSHTVNHPVMSKLKLDDQSNEIKESFNYLNGIVNGQLFKTFCYPYGGFHTFTLETEELLNKENCLFSFNVEHRDINNEDIKYRAQALPRYDCNVFPYGQCK